MIPDSTEIYASGGESARTEPSGHAIISRRPVRRASSLARLLQFGDSMLPTGAFSFSSTLEAAVQQNLVHDAASLQEYVHSALIQSSEMDAVVFLDAFRACRKEHDGHDEKAAGKEDAVNADTARLRLMDRALFRRKASEEARNMSCKTGLKLAEMAAEMPLSQPWKAFFRRWIEQIRSGKAYGVWPVTLGMLLASLEEADMALKTDASEAEASGNPDGESSCFTAPHDAGYGEDDALCVYYFSLAAGMLSAAVRLMRISHLDAQRVLFTECSLFDGLIARTQAVPPERMQAFAPMLDIMAAAHAHSHVRLFMS